MAKLTAKQEMFVLEYLKDLNATQAAIRAGYSVDTAKEIGCENLTKPNIKEAIDKAKFERQKIVKLDAQYVLDSLNEIAEKCKGKIPVIKDGKEVYIFDPPGANKAVELIGKHLAMFTEKIQADIKNENINLPEEEINKLIENKLKSME